MRRTIKPRKASQPLAKAKKPARKATKRRTNLTLDPDVVAGAAQYGKRHGTNLSQIVNGFLRSLLARTTREDDPSFVAQLTAPVRRLYGIAAGGKADRAAHREHLLKKYGSHG